MPLFASFSANRKVFPAECDALMEIFKSSDFQVLIGASLNLTDKIGVGARYGTSMSSIATDSYSSSLKTDVKNKAFTVMLSYKLF